MKQPGLSEFKNDVADLHEGAVDKMEDIVFEKEREELYKFKEEAEARIEAIKAGIMEECPDMPLA